MDTVENTSLGPGLVAFIIVVLLVIVSVLLWYSMVRHLRKVPPAFDSPDQDSAPAAREAAPPDLDVGRSGGSPAEAAQQHDDGNGSPPDDDGQEPTTSVS